MLVTVVIASRRRTIAVVISPDGVLPRRCTGIRTAGYAINVRQEHHTGMRSRGCLWEVHWACSGVSFSGARLSFSATRLGGGSSSAPGAQGGAPIAKTLLVSKESPRPLQVPHHCRGRSSTHRNAYQVQGIQQWQERRYRKRHPRSDTSVSRGSWLCLPITALEAAWRRYRRLLSPCPRERKRCLSPVHCCWRGERVLSAVWDDAEMSADGTCILGDVCGIGRPYG